MPELQTRLLSGACALAVLCAWYVLLAPTRIGGPLTPVVVRGESMLPAYEPDDLVVAYRSTGYEVGDVIVFRPRRGDPVVIHRVVEVAADGYVTRGDNAAARDPWEIPRSEVLGEARLRIPRIGWLLDPSGHPLLVAAFAGLVAAVAAAVATDTRAEVTDGATPLALVGLTAAGLLVPATYAAAATFGVTADGLATFTVPAVDSSTYLVAPGGGAGGPGGGPPGGA